MREWKKQNNGYNYMLNVIDVFSKYAWSIPMKNKTGKTTLEGFQKIVNESGRIPKHIWVDQGKEFYNKDVIHWAKENNIKIYSTYTSESKSVVAERFNRTLKEMMWRRFTAENTRNWIDMLDSLMCKYNTRVHSTIGMTPVQASQEKNFLDVLENTINKTRAIPKRKAKFKIGDKVRMSRKKGKFEKGHHPNWTEQLFIVDEVQDTIPITYKVKNLLDEKIEGSVYEKELQKSDQEVFRVEKVITKKKIDGV
jgi:hypothetical protein